MKKFQTTLLCMGIALTSTYALAASYSAPGQAAARAQGRPCPEPSQFVWAQQCYGGEDFCYWTAATTNFVLQARSKRQPKLKAKKTHASKQLGNAQACEYDAETFDRQGFIGKALAREI